MASLQLNAKKLPSSSPDLSSLRPETPQQSRMHGSIPHNDDGKVSYNNSQGEFSSARQYDQDIPQDSQPYPSEDHRTYDGGQYDQTAEMLPPPSYDPGWNRPHQRWPDHDSEAKGRQTRD